MNYILVPVFKELETTLLFLNSLEKSFEGRPYTVIIGDDSPDLEHQKHFTERPDSRVHIIPGNGNLWWGGTINLCISYLFSKFSVLDQDPVAFANNDVILNPQAIQHLEQALEQSPKDMFHPRVINQDGDEMSAGAQIISWVPFVTKHPKGNNADLISVDMATARYLLFRAKTLRKVGLINPRLPHYGGDNDFSLRAKSMGVATYIVTNAICHLDDAQPKMKHFQAMNINKFLASLISIRSPNSLVFKYRLVSSHINPILALFVTGSMAANTIARYFLARLTRWG